MTLAEKLPQMTDDALEALAVNARRLAATDAARDHAAAEALLPLVEAELTSRRMSKMQRMREAAAARPAKPKTAAAPKKRSTKRKD